MRKNLNLGTFRGASNRGIRVYLEGNKKLDISNRFECPLNDFTVGVRRILLEY